MKVTLKWSLKRTVEAVNEVIFCTYQRYEHKPNANTQSSYYMVIIPFH